MAQTSRLVLVLVCPFKHDGRLEGEGHCNGRRELHVAYSDRCSDFDRANLVVLQHLDEVDPFVALHKEIIAKKYRDRGGMQDGRRSY